MITIVPSPSSTPRTVKKRPGSLAERRVITSLERVLVSPPAVVGPPVRHNAKGGTAGWRGGAAGARLPR